MRHVPRAAPERARDVAAADRAPVNFALGVTGQPFDARETDSTITSATGQRARRVQAQLKHGDSARGSRDDLS